MENSSDNGGVYADGALTWNIEEVSAWSSITVSFKVQVAESDIAQTISNKATVSAGDDSFITNEVINYTESTDDAENPDGDSDNNIEKDPVDKPEVKPDSEKPASPQTGDRSILCLVMLLLISCGSFAVTAAYGKKKKEEN